MINMLVGFLFLIASMFEFKSARNTPINRRNYFNYWQQLMLGVGLVICGIILIRNGIKEFVP